MMSSSTSPGEPFAMADTALGQLVLTRIREFIREPEAVFWTLLFPILMTVGLGIAFRSRPEERAKIAVLATAPAAEATADRLRTHASVEVGILDDSAAASAMRLGRGTRCRGGDKRADLKPLTLYNMEGSPYCRKVRETLSELDLAYVIRNVPKGSPKRAELKKCGGKVQVPYLIDPNTKTEMYESDEIVAYLETQYRPGPRTTARGKQAH